MKSIELFAGAGGLALGLHNAGFRASSVFEWDRYCCDTTRENKERGVRTVKGWNVVEADVRSVDFSAFEDKVRLVSGGPPCQPFSLGGKHAAYDDHRDMFPQAIRAVREARPYAFIFENVKGLTRATFRNYFEYVRLQLEHPEITRRVDEDWTSHLARLEQHHTSGSREGLKGS
ncbi:DNA cytosine methyltransferase [Rhizobium leguminosarum]|uniref:DNA cytosine methyltransferase n=1 Tax=Rhizobium leguminosarum TaxID=384 RepID=UPI0021B0E0D7|nr:DNA cytosine methyltransferase [Rhizobium leguminosarum]